MAQKGFEYEENAYAALRKYDISIGGTAGASHDKPDLTIQAKGKTTGVELKNAPTAAGSLVMKYYNGKWDYGAYKGEIEKEFIHDMAEAKNLLRTMNVSGKDGVNWRGKIPHLQNDKNGKKIYVPPALSSNKRKSYAQDIEKFGGRNEVHIEISATMIAQYYIKKKCSYINVGTHGFFTLNGKDDLGLNKILEKNELPLIPDFTNNAQARIRVRCQPKGGGDYQFVTTMEFSGVTKSIYNLAPLRRGSKSDIDLAALKKDNILLAFK
jgi:hypothetical protein